jgi:ABC-type phosphate transport system substrate-binding protein
MSKNNLNKKSVLVLALGMVLAGGAAAQVAVIVNPKNPAASMTAEQVSNIFLGKSNTLPSGGTAAAVDQVESAAVRELFYTKVTGKQSAQVKAAWSRLVFSGKATPPKELASSAEVKKFVAANPDAIGYVEKSAVDGSVKAVLTVD